MHNSGERGGDSILKGTVERNFNGFEGVLCQTDNGTFKTIVCAQIVEKSLYFNLKTDFFIYDFSIQMTCRFMQQRQAGNWRNLFILKLK